MQSNTLEIKKKHIHGILIGNSTYDKYDNQQKEGYYTKKQLSGLPGVKTDIDNIRKFISLTKLAKVKAGEAQEEGFTTFLFFYYAGHGVQLQDGSLGIVDKFQEVYPIESNLRRISYNKNVLVFAIFECCREKTQIISPEKYHLGGNFKQNEKNKSDFQGEIKMIFANQPGGVSIDLGKQGSVLTNEFIKHCMNTEEKLFPQCINSFRVSGKFIDITGNMSYNFNFKPSKDQLQKMSESHNVKGNEMEILTKSFLKLAKIQEDPFSQSYYSEEYSDSDKKEQIKDEPRCVNCSDKLKYGKSRNFICDICEENKTHIGGYSCQKCDYDLCPDCKYFYKCGRCNKSIQIYSHQQRMVKNKNYKNGFICNKCRDSKGAADCFHCPQCQFDVCKDCKFDFC